MSNLSKKMWWDAGLSDFLNFDVHKQKRKKFNFHSSWCTETFSWGHFSSKVEYSHSNEMPQNSYNCFSKRELRSILQGEQIPSLYEAAHFYVDTGVENWEINASQCSSHRRSSKLHRFHATLLVKGGQVDGLRSHGGRKKGKIGNIGPLCGRNLTKNLCSVHFLS